MVGIRVSAKSRHLLCLAAAWIPKAHSVQTESIDFDNPEKMKDSFIKVSRSTKIYRICRVDHLVDGIKKGVLTLPRVMSWEDTHEAAYFKAELRVSGVLTGIENLGLDWFGQCWSTNAQSDAMWRIYNQSGESVRIETTAGKLFDSIESSIIFNQPSFQKWVSQALFIGRVSYHKERDLSKLIESIRFSDLALGGQSTGWANTLLQKRKAFSHEKEIRLLYQRICTDGYCDDRYLCANKTKSFVANGCVEILPEFMHIPFDWSKSIKSAMIGPRASKEQVELIRETLSADAPWLNVLQSSLYENPKNRIHF